MTELDAEHRDQMAEALRQAIFPNAVHAQAKRDCVAYADALAPLVAGWIADAWDAGWDARHESYWSGDQNPYRDNPSKDGED